MSDLIAEVEAPQACLFLARHFEVRALTMDASRTQLVPGRIQLVPSHETVQSAIDAYLVATRAMDANAVAEAFATDGVSNDPVGSPPHEGRDAIRQFIQGATAAIERIESTADNVFIAGDGAAFKWSMHLTGKRGQSVTVEGIDVIQVDEQGKIQALHAYWDPAPLLAVLGGQAG